MDADGLFVQGDFEAAARLYGEVIADSPADRIALVRLGEIALLENRAHEASALLSRALENRRKDRRAMALLAEARYRLGAFDEAAPLFRAAGRRALGRKLQGFGKSAPYQVDQGLSTGCARFVGTDPLPVVQVRANGRPPVNFFLDTGASEVVLDSAYAREIGAVRYGSERGFFAGGRGASFGHGRLGSLEIGGLTVRDIPVHLLDVRRFSDPVFGGLLVDGIIGTVLLYHFQPTIDYLRGELVLRPRPPIGPSGQAAHDGGAPGDRIDVPFWLAGDHYIVAFGEVNRAPPMLLLVDTGLAGPAFTCPESTIHAAGIRLDAGARGVGEGAGGQVRTVDFTLDRLALGSAEVRGLPACLGAFTPLEPALGFRVGGTVSHGFFKRFSLTIDFTRMRLLLDRGSPRSDGQANG